MPSLLSILFVSLEWVDSHSNQAEERKKEALTDVMFVIYLVVGRFYILPYFTLGYFLFIEPE